MAGGGTQAVEHHVHVACHQILQRRACTFVGDVGDEGFGLLFKQLTRQMVRGASTGRAVVELAGVSLHLRHEGLEVTRNVLGVDHQHLRHVGDECDRHKVFFDVVVELGVHRWRNGVVHGPHKQRVAVGCGAGRDAGAQRATRTTAVVNHQLFAGLFGELRRQRPRKRIRAPTRRERHDQGDGFGRPGALGMACHRYSGQTGCGQAQRRAPGESFVHLLSPVFLNSKSTCTHIVANHISTTQNCRPSSSLDSGILPCASSARCLSRRFRSYR